MVWLPEVNFFFKDMFICFDRMYERDRHTHMHTHTNHMTA